MGRAVGLRGEVYVIGDPDVADDFTAGAVYEPAEPLAGHDRLVVATSRVHSGRRVVRFVGVDTRDAAEALRDATLTVPRDEVELDEGAFWVDDLLGREVVDADGGPLGVLEAVLPGAAHDYLVVARPDGGEVLVPAVPELVEPGRDRVVVRPPPGLFDEG
ncbi:MAG: ribosome maturation factor RimM [Actinomycetota bacterium]|nr:ribosome maturation factor RimM [Actinomycetota bacterium]